MRKSIVDGYKELYEKLKSNKLAGFYTLNKPQIMIFDPDLIKNILVKDFAYFHDRESAPPNNIEPLTNHLANMTGKKSLICLHPPPPWEFFKS